MSSGTFSGYRDVVKTASGAGPGISPSRLCMGCNVARRQSGGIGQGVRWRCAACVARRVAA